MPLLAGTLLVLSGCASLVVPGAGARAPALPTAWIGVPAVSGAAATALVSWWQRFDDPVLVSLVEQSLQANTSVVAAQAALRQARAQRDGAAAELLPGVGSAASAQRSRSGGNTGNNFRARRLPSFTIGGSLGLSALTLGALTGGASLSSALLASVSLPVFDGGALRHQVQAQQAALEQAQAAYQGAVLVALQEVEDALVALRGDRERLAHFRNAADAAANSALLARHRYSSGLVDFQAVLDTQRTLLGAQDSVANVAASVSADHVRLYKALGGGWQADTVDAAASPAPVLAAPTRLPPP